MDNRTQTSLNDPTLITLKRKFKVVADFFCGNNYSEVSGVNT